MIRGCFCLKGLFRFELFGNYILKPLPHPEVVKPLVSSLFVAE